MRWLRIVFSSPPTATNACQAEKNVPRSLSLVGSAENGWLRAAPSACAHLPGRPQAGRWFVYAGGHVPSYERHAPCWASSASASQSNFTVTSSTVDRASSFTLSSALLALNLSGEKWSQCDDQIAALRFAEKLGMGVRFNAKGGL